jgi:hypothetical protein
MALSVSSRISQKRRERADEKQRARDKEAAAAPRGATAPTRPLTPDERARLVQRRDELREIKHNTSTAEGYASFLRGFIEWLGILDGVAFPGVGALKTACSIIAGRILGVLENRDKASDLRARILRAAEVVMHVLTIDAPFNMALLDQRVRELAEGIRMASEVAERVCKRSALTAFLFQDRDARALDQSLSAIDDATTALSHAVSIAGYEIGVRVAAGVEEVLRRVPDSAAADLPKQILDFAQWILRKTKGFADRPELFERALAWVLQERAPQVLLLIGGPGAGKSAAIAHILSECDGAAASIHERVIAFHVCSADMSEWIDPMLFVRNLSAQLRRLLPAYDAALRTVLANAKHELAGVQLDAQSSFERTILAPLRALGEADLPVGQTPLLIVIDSLDESLQADDGRNGRGTVAGLVAKAVRAGSLPPWLRVIASSRQDRAAVRPLSDMGMREEHLESLGDANRQALLQFARGRLPSVSPRALSAEEIEVYAGKLADASRGNFLYAVAILEGLRPVATRAGLRPGKIALDDFDSLPDGVAELYERSLARLALAREEQEGLRELLEVLLAAREPLSRAELWSVMRGVYPSLSDPGAGRPTFDRRLRLLDAYLVESEPADGAAPAGTARVEEAKLSVFHQSFADWLRQPGADAAATGLEFLHIGAERRGGHVALAVWWLRQLAARCPSGQTAILQRAVVKVLGSEGAGALPAGHPTPAGHFELPPAAPPAAGAHVPLLEACIYLVAAALSQRRDIALERGAELLAASGTKLGLADGEGWTALMYASEEGHAECVSLLLKAGADAGQADDDGWTALMYASEEGHAECVSLLLNHSV